MASTRDRSARARQFRAEMRAMWMQVDAPCGICGQQHIQWTAPANTPDAFEIDHIQPVTSHPELEFDPNNVRPAAHRCNRARGTDAPVMAGETSEEW